MGIIKQLLDKKEPFAVMQSFVFLKGASADKHRVYEVLTVKETEKEGNYLSHQDLTEPQIKEFKDNDSMFCEVLSTKDGRIYEPKGQDSFKELVKNKVSKGRLRFAY